MMLPRLNVFNKGPLDGKYFKVQTAWLNTLPSPEPDDVAMSLVGCPAFQHTINDDIRRFHYSPVTFSLLSVSDGGKTAVARLRLFVNQSACSTVVD